MELGDLNKTRRTDSNSLELDSKKDNFSFGVREANSGLNENHGNLMFRGNLNKQKMSDFEAENNKNFDQKYHRGRHKNYGHFFTKKSVQFFYFWARTRVVQRAIIILSIMWIILIFYKSLLVVELMRYDVNVKKETVEALLPKGVGFPKLFKDNFQQLFSRQQTRLCQLKIKLKNQCLQLTI